MTAEPADGRAEDEKRALRGMKTQRIGLLAGAIAFALGAHILAPSASVAAQIGTTLLVAFNAIGFWLLRPRRAQVPMIFLPAVTSLVMSASAVVLLLADGAADAVRFGLMYAFVAPFLGLLAPSRRGAAIAFMIMTAIAAAGAVYLEARAPTFYLLPALAFLATALALSVSIARIIERAQRDATLLRTELARRATSDDISGVSNRAHVSLLAQNEFARARRYGEPYSCLMIEIEGYDALIASYGHAASNAVVQVFTGYCVVVMRHCDSFGRLAPNRFLALLPETPTIGAHTLADRMCGDLGGLGVAFGGETLRFTVSIGCAQMHAVDRWAGDMLRRAEQGLADALERGGSCAVFAQVPISQPADTQEESAP